MVLHSGNSPCARLNKRSCPEAVLRANDSYLVKLPLSKLLECSVQYKTQWLTVAEPALQEVRRQVWQDNTRATRMVAGMRSCMRSWLIKSGS
jgi:hypothetical protein